MILVVDLFCSLVDISTQAASEKRTLQELLGEAQAALLSSEVSCKQAHDAKDALQTRFDQLELSNSQASADLQSAQSTLAAVQQELTLQAQATEQAQQECAVLQAAKTAAVDHTSQVQLRFEQLQADSVQVQQVHDQIQARALELSSQVQQLCIELDAARELNGDLTGRLNHASSELDQQRQAHAAAQTGWDTACQRVQELEAALSQLEQQRTQSQTALRPEQLEAGAQTDATVEPSAQPNYARVITDLTLQLRSAEQLARTWEQRHGALAAHAEESLQQAKEQATALIVEVTSELEARLKSAEQTSQELRDQMQTALKDRAVQLADLEAQRAIAIEQRKLLEVREGEITLLQQSRTDLQVQCAEQQVRCWTDELMRH